MLNAPTLRISHGQLPAAAYKAGDQPKIVSSEIYGHKKGASNDREKAEPRPKTAGLGLEGRAV
jgi:hypothetical protein